MPVPEAIDYDKLADTVIARIAKPTKYFSLEGPNLYFMVTKDQTPIDPQGLFR